MVVHKVDDTSHFFVRCLLSLTSYSIRGCVGFCIIVLASSDEPVVDILSAVASDLVPSLESVSEP